MHAACTYMRTCTHAYTCTLALNNQTHLCLNKCCASQHLFRELGRCEDARKWHNMILSGMQTTAQSLQSYLSTWDNFKDIWEINKDAFIRRYQKLKPTVASFESDIARCDICRHWLVELLGIAGSLVNFGANFLQGSVPVWLQLGPH